MSLQSTLNTKLKEDGYLTPTEAAETAEKLEKGYKKKWEWEDGIQAGIRLSKLDRSKKGRHDPTK